METKDKNIRYRTIYNRCGILDALFFRWLEGNDRMLAVKRDRERLDLCNGSLKEEGEQNE